MKITNRKSWLLSGVVISLALFGVVTAANIENVTNVKALELDGALYFGDSQDIKYVTMPNVNTSDKFSVKVPFVNSSGAPTARGSVIVSSTTQYGILSSMVAITATTTVMGVSDGVYATGQKGWMTILGYCSVLTTGTVVPGQILVTTATITGYAGPTTGTQVVGTAIGKAVEGNTTQGLTTVLIGL